MGSFPPNNTPALPVNFSNGLWNTKTVWFVIQPLTSNIGFESNLLD